MICLGLLRKKYGWTLTVRGWIVLFVCILSLCFVFMTTIYSFLSPTRPVHCDLLVLEGWLPDYAIEKSIETFNELKCELYVTTGVPLPQGHHLSEYQNYAELSAATLKRLGFEDSLVVAIPTLAVKRDRTYASAIALKKWLDFSGRPVQALNVYSLGPHARRSWLLFEKALGDQIAVGIIAADDLSYTPRYWWRSSRGVRSVIDETIAYIYARVFFYP